MVELKERSVINVTEEDKGLPKFRKFSLFTKRCRNLIIATLIGVLVIGGLLGLLFPKRRSITTITESSLKEVIETSDLSTVEYIYNSTVSVKDEKNKPKYHIAYEGTVKAGFDFNKITAELDKENKKVVIVIPKIKINSVSINDETIDYIFVKDKYDTETTFQEAYKLCYADLENKSKANKSIEKMAYENAVDSIKAIIMPLESRLPDGYVFDFRKESEAK